MIPYVEVRPIRVWGPFAIQPFGMLVLTGCVVGALVAIRHCRSAGRNPREIRDMLPWVLLPGFLLSYWTAVLLDDPADLLRRPFSFWRTMSSYGGFAGGALGAWLYLRRRKLPALVLLDCLALGLTVGWLFGRLGCSLVHDHPGRRSDFFLAVRYPDGPRHDLGLYEWWYTVLLVAVLLAFRRRQPPPGSLVALVAALYAPARFLLDFLRVGETRYLGLTSGQYFSVALLGVAAALTAAIRRRARRRAVQGPPR